MIEVIGQKDNNIIVIIYAKDYKSNNTLAVSYK